VINPKKIIIWWWIFTFIYMHVPCCICASLLVVYTLYTDVNYISFIDLIIIFKRKPHGFFQQVIDNVETNYIGSSNLSLDAPILLYPNTMFWEMTPFGKSVSNKLKKVHITGYKGKGLDMEFFKCLIRNGRNINSITICFDDNCTWKGAVGTLCLRSLTRASENVCITLKPRKEYMARVGGSMGTWISSLKLN
jgi:hypothetical protein